MLACSFLCPLTFTPKQKSQAFSTHISSNQVVGKLHHQRQEASNIADQGCSSPARQRHTGWLPTMNNSLPCAQILCCETNIQQHLCAWRKGKKSSFPRGEAQPSITPTVLVRIPVASAGMTDSSRGIRVWCLRFCRTRIIGNVIRAGSPVRLKHSWRWIVNLNGHLAAWVKNK